MRSSFVRKLFHLVPVLLVVSFSTMLLANLFPGDPARGILGPNATDEQVALLRSELHLDRALPVRYAYWFSDVARGDLGESLVTRQPVLDEIKERLPVTIEIAVLAQILALVLGVPLGVYTAFRSGGRFDRMFTGVSALLVSAPTFLIGLLLSFFIAVKLRWLPATGWVKLGDGIGENLRHALMPALALGLHEAPIYARLLRSEMMTTLKNDFMLAAKSKGLSSTTLLFRHAFRPSSFSLVTLAGLSFGRLLGGAVIVEFIFALPGLGSLIVESILNNDFIVVQGAVLFLAVLYVALSTILDAMYAVLDPRVRRA